MAITPVQEFFNGGVVTARDASLLKPGELQRAEECVYRHQDVAIWSAPGRTLYDPSSADANFVKGLACLTFDGERTDQILAWKGTTYYTSSFTALTGTFTPLTNAGTAICNTATSGSSPNIINTLTITDNNTFAYMPIGTLVFGPGIPVGATVLSINVNNIIATITGGTIAIPNTTSVTITFDRGLIYVSSNTGTEVLDVVQWEGAYYLLQGDTAPMRLFWAPAGAVGTNESLVTRRIGMIPVTQWEDGTGTLSGPSVQTGPAWKSTPGAGYYWFLITEIIDYGGVNEIESTYCANKGAPKWVFITTPGTEYVRINFPILQNNGANGTNRASHFCVYISEHQLDTTITPSLVTFKRVVVATVASLNSSGYSGVDIKYLNASVGPFLATIVESGPDVGAYGGTIINFGNPDGVKAIGGTSAYYDSSGTWAAQMKLRAFTGLTIPSEATITGIEVQMVAARRRGVPVPYTLRFRNTAGIKNSNQVYGIWSENHASIYTWGGQFDSWGSSFVPADLSTLELIVLKCYTNSHINWHIDYLTVKIYYTSTTVSDQSVKVDGTPFRTVTYKSQIGTSVSDPASFPPPTCTTGDIFQGHLVVNDTSNQSVIRYSLAGFPEYFPKPYVLNFQSRKKDRVTFIRRVGQVLVVGMRDSIKRVNYLPTEADADFHEGLAHEDIAVDHGIVGSQAGTMFDLTGNGVILGYVGYNGVYITDGITTRPLCSDLDWKKTVNMTNLSTCILRVYPTEKWLILYYNPYGAAHSQNTKALIFYYGKDHVKEDGSLPVTGPISVSARSAAEGTLGGVSVLLTGHGSTGFIYVEDNGLTMPTSPVAYQTQTLLSTNGSPAYETVINCPKITTRLMFAAGLERTIRGERIYLGSTPLPQLKLSETAVTITNCVVTKDSIYVTKTGTTVFSTVKVGTRVRGTNIKPGTIVVTVTAGTSNPVVDAKITLSAAAIGTGATDSLIFDTGTLTVMMSSEQIGNDGPELCGSELTTPLIEKSYISTMYSTIPVAHPDNFSQGLQIHLERILMPDGSYVDLGAPMRLHYFNILISESGMEMNRASN